MSDIPSDLIQRVAWEISELHLARIDVVIREPVMTSLTHKLLRFSFPAPRAQQKPTEPDER